MIGLGVLGALLLLAVTGVGVTVWMVQRVWKQAAFVGKLVVSLVATLAVSGAAGTLVGLITAFGAVGGESVDPSQKARILAEGISEAMNCTAFSVMLWLPSAIAVAVMSRKRGGAAARD
jgi:hypothetical protein